MPYLLDTQVFLWWLNDSKRLKKPVRQLIEDRSNQIFTSVVNGWEISIKHRSGKLSLKTTLRRCFEVSPFERLNITLDHILELDKLPLHHKDPFDRLLIAQAKVEKLTIITDDKKIGEYAIKVFN